MDQLGNEGDKPDHHMNYSAGAYGFSRVGIPDREPAWRCACGHWHYVAKSMPHRRDGTNLIEAKRAYLHHLQALGL